MKKLAIFTDLHLGVRNSSKVFRTLMREYFREVFFPHLKEEGVKDILFGGDFFDSRTSISLHEITYVWDEFIPLLEEYDMTLHAVLGNHDIAYRNTNLVHSLMMFKHHPNFNVIEDDVHVFETGGDKNFVLCPWLNDENEDRLLKSLNYYADDDHILLGHFEINGLQFYKNSKVCEGGLDPKTFKNYHKVLSGHFHHPSQYGNIEYIGAMFHMTWQDHNDWRGYYIYDVENNEFNAIENEYCIFTKLVYSNDLLDTSDEDLAVLCEGQFVRIIINETYDKIELKDLMHRIEECKPVKIDIIDNTILETSSETDSEETGDESTKSILDHAKETFKDRNDLYTYFEEILEQAKQEMKEIA